MGNRILKICSIVLVTVSLAACGNINATGKNQPSITTSGQIGSDQNTVIQPAPSYYTLQKFTWDVSGQADINFTIIPSGTDFVVNVSRYNGRVLNVTLRMSPNESASVHNMLRTVFTGNDGFINGAAYNGTNSIISEMDRNGRVYTVRFPQLYSGTNAALTELFSNITSRIYLN